MSEPVAEVAEPVGLEEIARRLGVKRDTVDRWRQRGVLPPPAVWTVGGELASTVGGRPLWAWSAIEAWALDTGRLSRES